MGQQQLLLLVLSAVIVGLAIVVGINMFGENATQANQDAVIQDLLVISHRAQGWYRRPAMLGGGGRSFTNVTLDTLRFRSENVNGRYTLVATDTSLVITGIGKEGVTVQMTVYADSVSPAIIQ